MAISSQKSKEINVPGMRRKHSRKVVKRILKKKNLLQSNINKKRHWHWSLRLQMRKDENQVLQRIINALL